MLSIYLFRRLNLNWLKRVLVFMQSQVSKSAAPTIRYNEYELEKNKINEKGVKFLAKANWPII